MQSTVIGDLDQQTYTCSRGDFMDRLLGKFDINYKEILKTLKESGIYRSQHWRGLTRVSEGQEARYYISLAKACNAINSHQVVVEAANILGENESVDGVWMHRPESLTDSVYRHYTETRPGISYVVCRRSKGTAEDAFRDGINEYVALRECASGVAGPSKGKQKSQPKLDSNGNYSLNEKEVRMLRVQWLRTIIPVQIAPGNRVEKAQIVQLGIYLRLILQNQQDRHFALDLLFVDEELFLFYCDRSGLLCTINDPIYIHEDPLELIRVISSFALMSPSRLGWDTAMKLVTSKITSPRYSFDSEIPLDILPHKTADIDWEITLGSNIYRTSECIYNPRDEVMIGNATLIWKAVCKNNDELPHAEQGKLVTIKQSWVPVLEGVLSELDLYKIGYDYCENLISHHVVQEGTNTVVDLRQGLEGLKESGIKDYFWETPFQFHPRRIWITPTPGLWDKDPFDITPRALCRLVMPFQYRTVDNFVSIRELLTTFLDAVCGKHLFLFMRLGVHESSTNFPLSDYEKLYHRGLFHRNICPSHIVIDTTAGEAYLINLEDAKYDTEYQPRTIAQAVQEDNIKLIKMAQKLQADVIHLHRRLIRLDDDLAWALVTLHNVRNEEIEAIQAFWALWTKDLRDNLKLEQEGKLREVPSTLRLADFDLPISVNTLVPPDYEGRFATNVIRTYPKGAKAFTSSDLLINPLSCNAPAHSAIHDMDSFLQSLVYICLTREGPGGRTIQDLREQDPGGRTAERVMKSNEINRAIRALFANPPEKTLAHKLHFLDSQQERDRILALVSDYFEPAKPLVHRWATILQRGFERQSKKNDNLYTVYPIQSVKNAIREAIERLPDPAVSNPFEYLADAVQKERDAKVEDSV
ncbi:hypothetical protein CPC08DRAFT_817919 [Agrocybe pediades]|nr:hypothetical protein CPC08DRAFT_817919 [Agrocybe pediades]